MTDASLPLNLAYYAQRHVLWSLFDHGVTMDREGWYSVTPESIAQHIAKRVMTSYNSDNNSNRRMTRRVVVVDGFCGCGGNTVQFGLQAMMMMMMMMKQQQHDGDDDHSGSSGNGGDDDDDAVVWDWRVLAVDIDPAKIRHTQHNCSIYGVPTVHTDLHGQVMITTTTMMMMMEEDHHAPPCDAVVCLVQTDFVALCKDPGARTVLDTLARRVWWPGDTGGPQIEWRVLLAPPWSGPQYSDLAPGEHYCIETMMAPVSGRTLYEHCSRNISRDIAFLLPRNIRYSQVASLAPPGEVCEIESNFLFRRVKCVTAYFGALVMDRAEQDRQRRRFMHDDRGAEMDDDLWYEESDTYLLGVVPLSELRRMEQQVTHGDDKHGNPPPT